MGGVKGRHGRRLHIPGKGDEQARMYPVRVVHAVAPDAGLRLQKALDMLLGSRSNPESQTPGHGTDDLQGCQRSESGSEA